MSQGPGPISRQDIEDLVRSMIGDVEQTVEEARPALVSVGIAAAIAVVLLSYVLGRRSGRRRSAMVEIRRL
jgi:hypothetical protein